MGGNNGASFDGIEEYNVAIKADFEASLVGDPHGGGSATCYGLNSLLGRQLTPPKKLKSQRPKQVNRGHPGWSLGVFARFVLPRMGRMVRSDPVNRAISERGENRSTVRFRFHRWIHLDKTVEALCIFAGEQYVVRRRRCKDGEALSLRIPNELHASGRGDMEDVKRTSRLANAVDREANRFDLGLGRAHKVVLFGGRVRK